MQKFRLAAMASLSLLVAGSAMANNFRAADQIYLLNGLGGVPGAAGAFFDQDVTITNTTTDRVQVDVALLANTTGDNSGAVGATRPLAVLEPGERRTYVKFVQSGLNQTTFNGTLLFFACRAGSTCGDCGLPGETNCRNITVESRAYTTGNCVTAAGPTLPCSFGNDFPGMPWYLYASRNADAVNLSKVTISGVTTTGAPGSGGFRTNIGLVNATQYSTTKLRVTAFSEATRAQVGSPFEVDLGPLGRIQSNITNMVAGFTGIGYVVIEQVSVTPVANPPVGCEDGCPAFYAYGVSLDNVSNDPTYLEPQYLGPLTNEAIGALYPQKAPRRATRRR
ncbi:MAG TPA: hypothetical protein VNM92_12690 [Thermoanaerobaculia bacterium]|nr:hypothetical protein [Thermoanaerobaculia bacterium]